MEEIVIYSLNNKSDNDKVNDCTFCNIPEMSSRDIEEGLQNLINEGSKKQEIKKQKIEEN